MTDADKSATVLRLMTPKQAEVWRMVFDGYKQYEIAAALNKAEATVSILIARGRRRVKKYEFLLKNINKL